ncbi:MAG TPA: DUF4097 family beta strand repeat-containing protein [Pyrinomonadaceae bacterium]|jgi:flagellar biosynthesis GTPase FlhF|nr:DUF4097 family beta strand repeat-containing protein [Pyrinomonadaceae bacterium]
MKETKMLIKRKIYRALLAAACGLSVLASSGATQSAQTREELREEFHRTYPLAPGGRVSLENIQGAVRIMGWERNEVKVDAVKRAYSAERLAEAEIRVDASEDAVRIKTKYPEGNLNFNSDARERARNPATVEYTLTVPRNARLDKVALVSGALTIEGIAGEVKASSVSGHVAARALTGRTNISVVSGALDLDYTQLSGESHAEISSVSGAVTVTLASDANAELRVNTVQGSISNDFGLPVRQGRFVGRDLAGVLGRGGPSIKLSNVSGSVRVRRADDGRPLSTTTNLLSEARRDDESEDEFDAERDATREAEREERDIEREKRRAERDKRQSERDSRREAEREKRGKSETEIEIEREARDAAREDEREMREAAREIQREAANIAREAERAVREAEREARRASREDRMEINIDASDTQQHAQVSNSFNVSGTPRVRVETFDGRITVRAWDKPEVMFTAFKRAHDEKEMRGISLRAHQANGEISLVAEFDKAFAHQVRSAGKRILSFSSGASVNYEVYVPRNATVRASTGDGRLYLEGVRGELDVRTGDGSIEVSGGGGSLHAETGDGHIRVMDFDGRADTRTGDGRITLEGRFTDLAARTGDGSISLALPSGSNATVETDSETVVNDGLAVAEDADSSRRVRRWRIGSGGTVFTLRTGDGQIHLRRR